MTSKRFPIGLAAATVCLLLAPSLARGADLPYQKEKELVVASVERQHDGLVEAANKVWSYAETALKEKRSAEVLASYLESEGFRVTRGVAGMPTAFLAEYGSGQPIIGIMGEYDALPDISQKAKPERDPLKPGGAGHGCGHNLFGAASAGAAVAVKDFLKAKGVAGTIRFYGTPAEEAVGGKIYMVKAGLFNDVDVALAWHPDTMTRTDVQSSQAIVDFHVKFHGRAAHAAYDPWNGRSALDAVSLFTHAMDLMREHVKPTVRIHYVIDNGGSVPNVVPEYSSVWIWIRDSRRDGVASVLERARKAAAGAAQATETKVDVIIEGGDYETLPNRAGGLLMQKNLEWLGDIQYSPEEQAFARELQRNAGVPEEGINGSIAEFKDTAADPEGGSTDVGDVSWVVPVINMNATTAPVGVPWHGWAVVASGGMSIGHKGMILAAKALGTTAVDLFKNETARREIIEEFKKKTDGHTYESFVTGDTPPLPEGFEN